MNQDRRLPAEIIKDAERYRKIRTLAENSISAGLEIKTERLNHATPKEGEEIRLYVYQADISHIKEVHGKSLDEVVDAMALA